MRRKGSRIMSTSTGGGWAMRVELVVRKSAAVRIWRRRREDCLSGDGGCGGGDERRVME